MNILVLNSSERWYATQSIIQAGEKHGHRMGVLDPALFSPLVSNVEAGYDRVYALLPKTATRITISDVYAIIPRIGNNLTYNSYISERTKEGIFRAKNSGKTLGRPYVSKDKTKRRKSGYLLRMVGKRQKIDQAKGHYKAIDEY
jgi:hypothetical protein